MKNGKWEPVDLGDVKKDTPIIYAVVGFNPRGCEPSKIIGIAFDIHGKIAIEFENCLRVAISDIKRDHPPYGKQIQLYQQVPLMPSVMNRKE